MPTCTGTKDDGTPCGAKALKSGGGLCFHHNKRTREKARRQARDGQRDRHRRDRGELPTAGAPSSKQMELGAAASEIETMQDLAQWSRDVLAAMCDGDIPADLGGKLIYGAQTIAKMPNGLPQAPGGEESPAEMADDLPDDPAELERWRKENIK
jgi:hypothetical protein